MVNILFKIKSHNPIVLTKGTSWSPDISTMIIVTNPIVALRVSGNTATCTCSLRIRVATIAVDIKADAMTSSATPRIGLPRC